jgi:nucleoside-diphosphate-sugar epimerase
VTPEVQSALQTVLHRSILLATEVGFGPGIGQISRAVADDLLEHGWHVTVSHRDNRPLPNDLIERGAKIVILDREKPGELAQAVKPGVDALIDTIAFRPEHAHQLLEVQHMSVRSSSSHHPARIAIPAAEPSTKPLISEWFSRPTRANSRDTPSGQSWSRDLPARKIALERTLLTDAATRVTRPGTIHGPGSRIPREWWFVKRILDGRKVIPLAYRGTSRFHRSSVFNIAALARVAIEAPANQVLNIGDPSAPSTAEIAAFVAQHLDYTGDIIEIPGEDYPATLGRIRGPCRAPLSSICRQPPSCCNWLVETASHGDGLERFPWFRPPPDLFDYGEEDRLLDAYA